MWTGCLTALITPFRDRRVDYDALGAIVEGQIAAGVHGLVPCGSTGESATLTHDEHAEVVRQVVGMARGRVPVIAGTGSNSTAEAIKLTRAAEEAGAAGALLISPYYNKPTQDGIYRHYAAVAEASTLPLIVYNIPGRTASLITAETMARLSQIPTIVGVKEATGSMQQVFDTIAQAAPDFAVWSGDDVMTLPIMAAGGVGVISVTSNVVPHRMAELCTSLLAGDVARGRTLMRDLLPLVNSLFLEINPIPVKTAMAMMGKCTDDFRLPLTPMSAAPREKLAAVLRDYDLA